MRGCTPHRHTPHTAHCTRPAPAPSTTASQEQQQASSNNNNTSQQQPPPPLSHLLRLVKGVLQHVVGVELVDPGQQLRHARAARLDAQQELGARRRAEAVEVERVGGQQLDAAAAGRGRELRGDRVERVPACICAFECAFERARLNARLNAPRNGRGDAWFVRVRSGERFVACQGGGGGSNVCGLYLSRLPSRCSSTWQAATAAARAHQMLASRSVSLRSMRAEPSKSFGVVGGVGGGGVKIRVWAGSGGMAAASTGRNNAQRARCGPPYRRQRRPAAAAAAAHPAEDEAARLVDDVQRVDQRHGVAPAALAIYIRV